MAALPLPARGDRRIGALRTQDPDPGEPERGAGPYNKEHPHMAVVGTSIKDFPAGKESYRISSLQKDPFSTCSRTKRACKRLETIPSETETHLLGYAMELDSKQKISSDCGAWATKAKQNSMVFENHGSRGTAQPCPRCIAGESGHFNHILSF